MTVAPRPYFNGCMKALFPGSFDPPTNGHINLIRRGAEIFEELHVVIAVNVSKHYTFDADERSDLMHELVRPYPNVHLHLWDGLIVDFAQAMGIKVMLRGVRALADFQYEFELSMTNKELNPGIETVFLPTDPQYFVLRSSAIKEIAKLGGDVSRMVPPVVAKALRDRIDKL